MLAHIHNHIISELQQNTKTDTIFIIAAILLNLIALSVNSGIAEESRNKDNLLIVMILFVSLIVVVNLVVIFGLLKGRQTRSRLLKGLINIYRDEGVAKYYDESLLANYNSRYILFILVVVFTGVIAAIVPFVIR